MALSRQEVNSHTGDRYGNKARGLGGIDHKKDPLLMGQVGYFADGHNPTGD